MPLVASNCTPIDDQRCNSLSTISQHLLEKTYEAISTCFDGGCGAAITAYITTGNGDDGVVDALTVALLGIDPSPLTTNQGPSRWIATFEVRLRESGWPIVRIEGGVAVPPPPAEQAQAAAQLLSHGEAIHRRLSALKSKGQLGGENYVCGAGAVGTLLPVIPQGGVAGWSILVTIDLPWH